ncbi:MAG: hypothetical protein KC613_27440 [Myxococcales bacterium]|nr:hypothetical protein [Myxococcales bacterium]
MGRTAWVQHSLLAADLAHDRAIGGRLLDDARSMGLPAALTRIHTAFERHPPWMRVRSPAGETGTPAPRGPSTTGLSLEGPPEECVANPPRLLLRGRTAQGDPVLVVQPLFLVPMQVDPLPLSLAFVLPFIGLLWRRRAVALIALSAGATLLSVWPGPGHVGPGDAAYAQHMASYLGTADGNPEPAPPLKRSNERDGPAP